MSSTLTTTTDVRVLIEPAQSGIYQFVIPPGQDERVAIDVEDSQQIRVRPGTYDLTFQLPEDILFAEVALLWGPERSPRPPQPFGDQPIRRSETDPTQAVLPNNVPPDSPANATYIFWLNVVALEGQARELKFDPTVVNRPVPDLVVQGPLGQEEAAGDSAVA